LEACIRDNLNENAERAMAVLEPLKVTITNYEGTEMLETALHPLKPEMGTRQVAFSNVVYIDKADFSQNPPPKYQRLKPDGYVRLKGAYIIHCDEVITDDNGEVVELKCSYIPESRSSSDTSGIKVKGTIQWVDGLTGVDAEIRRYGVLLKDAEYAGQDFGERMNLDSEHIFYGKAEPYLAESKDGKPFQLMRVGYYKKCQSQSGGLVLSEIVSLKDNFNK
jgi:glutaminyl-tRNA synthetase